MPSFDIVSKVDIQTLDNAINVVSKEITNRFDFKGSHVVIELNKKDFKVNLEADSEMKLDQIIDFNAVQRGVGHDAPDFIQHKLIHSIQISH